MQEDADKQVENLALIENVTVEPTAINQDIEQRLIVSQGNETSTAQVKPESHLGCQYSTDNGIFQFMTADRATELYHRIHTEGVPELEWKYYGRRNPDEIQCESTNIALDESVNSKDFNQTNTAINTEFDFGDEDFSELRPETSVVGESLQLQKRPEAGSEKKTNLNDIMCDIMKETHPEDE